MLVVMKAHASADEVRAVCDKIESLGYRAHSIPGAERTAIGVTGNKGEVEPGTLDEMAGVQEVIRVTKPYKLVSRDMKDDNTVVSFPGTDATFGGPGLAIIAGPCAIESREQAFAIAERVRRAGAQFFRGGAYKPRTSPYSFQGLGEEALRIMAEVRDQFGLKIVTEAIDNESLELVEEYADVIQIGARNMQNFSLLKRAGRASKPVLLKRGMSATLEEFLMAAEYVMSEGNYNVILCERGVRTFADHTRNTLDLSLIPAVQRLSHLGDQADGFFLGEPAILLDLLAQVFAVNKFHDQEAGPVYFTDLEQVRDIRVAYFGKQPGFLLKTANRLFVRSGLCGGYQLVAHA